MNLLLSCFTFPIELMPLFMNSPQTPNSDDKCLLSHGSKSCDQLIDTSRSGTNYLACVFALIALLRKCSLGGSGNRNKGKATISKH